MKKYVETFSFKVEKQRKETMGQKWFFDFKHQEITYLGTLTPLC